MEGIMQMAVKTTKVLPYPLLLPGEAGGGLRVTAKVLELHLLGGLLLLLALVLPAPLDLPASAGPLQAPVAVLHVLFLTVMKLSINRYIYILYIYFNPFSSLV